MSIEYAVYQLHRPFWRRQYIGTEAEAREIYSQLTGLKQLVWMGNTIETNDTRYEKDSTGFYKYVW